MDEPAEEALDGPWADGEPDERPADRWRVWLLLGSLGVLLLGAVAFAIWHRPASVCLAVATSLTGDTAASGTESLAAIQLAADEANRGGGIRGRRIELVTLDDESSPATGRRNAATIGRGPCLAVLGHYLSTVSLAAGPVYRDARIPALTASAFADELTETNPWYFRAQFTSSMQGRAIAEYLAVLNGAPAVELVRSNDSFGRSFEEGFLKAYPPGRATRLSFDPAPAKRAESARKLAQAIPESAPPEIVVLGTASANIPDVIMALRRAGRTGPVITTAGAGSVEFLRHFAAEPEERNRPGFFSNNLFATPPVIFDSAGAEAQAFAARYREATHRQPSWVAAGYYDATRVLIEAMRRAEIRNRESSRAEDRDKVRAELAAMNGPLTGVPGLTRTLYFNARRNMPGPVRMGVFARDRFMTSSNQLVPVEDPDTIDLAAETAAGHVVTIGGEPFWLQKVVYAGLDFNRLSRVDLKEGTFNVDLNLWLRFVGTDDSPTRIEFPDLLSRDAFDPARPIDSSTIDVPAYIGQPIGTRTFEPYNYRLYRISAPFKASFDLHDYPFDAQELLVRFHNRNQRRELVTYVVDTQGLELANSQQRLPTDLTPFRGLQQWRLGGLRYFVESLSLSSSLGKPASDPRARIEYPGFAVAIDLQRQYGIFLIKTMIPLLLLVTVVFATLFLPGNLFRERINIPVTAILTSSVLLLSVNNQLGDIGYTVAIEYIFYGFFGLCLSAMLVGITYDGLCEKDCHRQAAMLARAGQAFYLTMVLLAVLTIWWKFGR